MDASAVTGFKYRQEIPKKIKHPRITKQAPIGIFMLTVTMQCLGRFLKVPIRHMITNRSDGSNADLCILVTYPGFVP